MKDLEIIDHTIWEEKNLGKYKISIIARLNDPKYHNVAYMIRLENRDLDSIDFMLSLKGFNDLGKLCIALSKFCEKRIPSGEKNIEKLKSLLTYENIMNFTELYDLRE